jgi:hypothetical protein
VIQAFYVRSIGYDQWVYTGHHGVSDHFSLFSGQSCLPASVEGAVTAYSCAMCDVGCAILSAARGEVRKVEMGDGRHEAPRGSGAWSWSYIKHQVCQVSPRHASRTTTHAITTTHGPTRPHASRIALRSSDFESSWTCFTRGAPRPALHAPRPEGRRGQGVAVAVSPVDCRWPKPQADIQHHDGLAAGRGPATRSRSMLVVFGGFAHLLLVG